MREAVLSPRHLNRILLARQLLLERSALPIPRALDRVGGLQTQYAPSGYVGLWSRLRGFERAALTRALERGAVVQGTLMRTTIHLVSREDYPLLAAGIRRARREWWFRVNKDRTEAEMDAMAEAVRRHLRDGPRYVKELNGLLEAEGSSALTWGGASLWVDILRVPPSGTWERRRADRYGLAETVVGPSRPCEDEGLDHLARRYLGGFGPATVDDVAGWAGVPPSWMKPAVQRVGTRRFRDEAGAVLYDLPRAPRPDPSVAAPVRFLPTWDATLLAHARRSGILPEPFRPLVFSTKNPQSVGTFLVDGRVAGAWRAEGSRIRLDPFEPIPRSARRELEDEAAGLAGFHAPDPDPSPGRERTRRRGDRSVDG
jgi:hypothetical protein